MTSKSIASALTLLTSEQFTPSDLTDNNALEAFLWNTSPEVGKSPTTKTVTIVKVMRKFQEIALPVHLGEPDVPICEAIPQLETEQLDEHIYRSRYI